MYKHSVKAPFNFYEFSDYFRALGKLALNLIAHDSLNPYFICGWEKIFG